MHNLSTPIFTFFNGKSWIPGPTPTKVDVLVVRSEKTFSEIKFQEAVLGCWAAEH
jgi:hypothetical protein